MTLPTDSKNCAEQALLSPRVQQEIDHWLRRYPAEHKRSAVLTALRLVQEENGGYLTEKLMQLVADYLEMPAVAVYEVASFYSLFHTKPVGKHVIHVCTNISCMLSGCDKILQHFKKRLGIDLDQTTLDGKFTLKEYECLAACAQAPVALIGKKYYEKLTPEKVDALLASLEAKK